MNWLSFSTGLVLGFVLAVTLLRWSLNKVAAELKDIRQLFDEAEREGREPALGANVQIDPAQSKRGLDSMWDD